MKTKALLFALLCGAIYAQIVMPSEKPPVDLVPLTLEVSKLRQQAQVQAQIQAARERRASDALAQQQAADNYAQWYLNQQRQLAADRKRLAQEEEARNAFFIRERAIAAERAKLPPDPYKVAREEGARKYWASVKAGMTKEEVTRLVGGPNMIVGNRWIYTTVGAVIFESEKVAAVK